MANIDIDRKKPLKDEPNTGHNRWHPDITPVLEVDEGEEVVFQTRDALDGQFNPNTTAANLAQVEAGPIHPLTGPVFIKGAQPGDLLEIEFLDIAAEPWAFSAVIPGLGFLRDILIAAVLGAGAGADVFFVAFKLPNLFRRLFAEGAFSMAFVPMFAGRLEEKGKAEAQVFAEAAFSVLLWTLLAFVIVIELAMPWIMVGFAPGFVADNAKFDLAVTLTRITFPYLLLISLVSLMAGVLNSLGRFAAAAATLFG